jgi:hypothetical protein
MFVIRLGQSFAAKVSAAFGMPLAALELFAYLL